MRSSPRPALLIVTTGTMVMVLSGLQTIVVPVIGDIADQLGAPLNEVGWILTANLLAAAVTTPLIGRLGDLYGKRQVILAVLTVVAVGSLVAALTTDLLVLIGARVLQAAAYGLFPLAIGVLRDELPEDRLIPGMALVSALLSIGGGMGLVATGLLSADGGDYHRIFWLSLVATIVPLVLCAIVLPRRSAPARGGGIDWWGAVLLGAALVGLLLPLSQAATWGWGSVPTVLCIVLALVSGWAFVVVERRRAVPLVSPWLLTYRPVWVCNLVAVLLGMAAFSSFLGISQFVQEPGSAGFGFDASVLETVAVFLLPGFVVGTLLAPLGGRLIHRYGGRAVLSGSAAFGASSFVGLVFWHDAPWQIILLNVVCSVGNNLSFAAIPAVLVQHVNQSDTGVATGIASVARSVGSSVASTLAATLIATFVVAGTGATSVTAYIAVFLVGACSFLAIIGLGLVGLPRHRAKRRRPVGVTSP